MIWEELREPLIFTELEAKNAGEVFDQVGQAFINLGMAKESYLNALREREAEYPTGLDIDGFGIAIPHTDVSHVNESGTAIALLKDPVTFTVMGTDDEYTQAKIVFMLCVKDPSTHMDKLQRIIEMIQDRDFLERLALQTTKEDIIGIVKEKENTL